MQWKNNITSHSTQPTQHITFAGKSDPTQPIDGPSSLGSNRSHGYQTRMRDEWSRCHGQYCRKQQRGRVGRGMIFSVILLHWWGDHGYTKELFRWSDVWNRLTGENLVNCWKWGDPWDGIWRHVLIFWKWETDWRLADSLRLFRYSMSVS